MKNGTIEFPTVDLPEGRKLTLVAHVRDLKDIIKDDKLSNFFIQFGYSVKNPLDKENPVLASTIAKGRALNKPTLAVGVRAKGVSKEFLNNIAKLMQDEFTHRFGNYITTSRKKERREATVEPS